MASHLDGSDVEDGLSARFEGWPDVLMEYSVPNRTMGEVAVQATTDLCSTCPTIDQATALAKAGGRVHLYQWRYTMGHGSELAFVFGNLAQGDEWC